MNAKNLSTDLLAASILVASLLTGPVVAQEAPAGKDRIPAWLIGAREAMQVRGTYGLAFVIPDAARPIDEATRLELRQRSVRASRRCTLCERVWSAT